MEHKLLKFYSLIILVSFAFLTTKAINCLLVLPIIFDLTSDLFNIKKNEKINKGLKIYSLTLIFFYIVRWLALMIDYLIFGEKSEYFIFGVGFFAVFFANVDSSMDWTIPIGIFGGNKVLAGEDETKSPTFKSTSFEKSINLG